MLRVRLEIVPFGDEDRVREIGRLEIANVTAEGLVAHGDYKVRFETDTRDGLESEGEYHFGKWPRDLGAWRLVQAILRLVVGEPVSIRRSSKTAATYVRSKNG